MTTKAIIDHFEVLLEPEEEGGYHIWCPRLRGCHSEGETREDALANIKEAIEGWLESAAEVGISSLQHETLRIAVPPAIRRS
jgi:predicted RNase H-like HicB family nuclease